MKTLLNKEARKILNNTKEDCEIWLCVNNTYHKATRASVHKISLEDEKEGPVIIFDDGSLTRRKS
jgi:hypothetical protein